MKVTILSGGVGGSKLVEGMARVVSPTDITVIGNMGDDIDMHGLRICPDLDIVTYTLAGIVNRETGWGVRDDTFHALNSLSLLGEDTWFRLGDRDLATHILRTSLLAQGMRATEVSLCICERMGISTRVIPPTDACVRTQVLTPSGWKPFQEYFVRDGYRDDVLDVSFRGSEDARITEEADDAIRTADLVVIAPSNPIASIGPILSVGGVREALIDTRARKIAVSPLVGGKSLKGPSDRMMTALGLHADARGVADYYQNLADVLVIDRIDERFTPDIKATGCTPFATETVMKTEDDKIRLAQEVLKLYAVPLHDD